MSPAVLLLWPQVAALLVTLEISRTVLLIVFLIVDKQKLKFL